MSATALQFTVTLTHDRMAGNLIDEEIGVNLLDGVRSSVTKNRSCTHVQHRWG